jgi:hypothetical protein
MAGGDGGRQESKAAGGRVMKIFAAGDRTQEEVWERRVRQLQFGTLMAIEGHVPRCLPAL